MVVLPSSLTVVPPASVMVIGAGRAPSRIWPYESITMLPAALVTSGAAMNSLRPVYCESAVKMPKSPGVPVEYWIGIDTTSTPSLTESATTGMETVFTVSVGPKTTFVVVAVKSAAAAAVLPFSQP